MNIPVKDLIQNNYYFVVQSNHTRSEWIMIFNRMSDKAIRVNGCMSINKEGYKDGYWPDVDQIWGSESTAASIRPATAEEINWYIENITRSSGTPIPRVPQVNSFYSIF